MGSCAQITKSSKTKDKEKQDGAEGTQAGAPALGGHLNLPQMAEGDLERRGEPGTEPGSRASSRRPSAEGARLSELMGEAMKKQIFDKKYFEEYYEVEIAQEKPKADLAKETIAKGLAGLLGALRPKP